MNMIKNILFLSLFNIVSYTTSVAQMCNDIPITLVDEVFIFEATDVISYGDSMISFKLVNDHATDYFAYPQAKLVPITALPTGMALATVNLDWMVFESAWTVGDTADVHLYYDVNTPVPVNYMVTFQLWLNNLTPVTDSCYFMNNYVVNLRPELTGITNADDVKTTIFPNPVNSGQDVFLSSNSTKIPGSYTITNLTGEVVKIGEIKNGAISTKDVLPGMYLLQFGHHPTPDSIIKLLIF